MNRKLVAAAGAAALLLITGCQPASSNADAETEALKEQITQLQQQIKELEQQKQTAESDSLSSTQQEQPSAENPLQEQTPVTDPSQEHQSDAAEPTLQSQEPHAQPDLNTTHAIEELVSMVDAFVAKADAAAPGSMEQFFALKQEEKQIDDNLDLHDDELEALYRQNKLSKEDYKSMEWRLDALEGQLDKAEDRLDQIFGIDD